MEAAFASSFLILHLFLLSSFTCSFLSSFPLHTTIMALQYSIIVLLIILKLVTYIVARDDDDEDGFADDEKIPTDCSNMDCHHSHQPTSLFDDYTNDEEQYPPSWIFVVWVDQSLITTATSLYITPLTTTHWSLPISLFVPCHESGILHHWLVHTQNAPCNLFSYSHYRPLYINIFTCQVLFCVSTLCTFFSFFSWCF